MIVGINKTEVKIKIVDHLSSLEKADFLESLSLMINTRGLVNVSIEDLEIFAGKTCEAYIEYSESVNDA